MMNKHQFWDFSHRFADNKTPIKNKIYDGLHIKDIIDHVIKYGKDNQYILKLYTSNESFVHNASVYFYETNDNTRYEQYRVLCLPLEPIVHHIITPKHDMETMNRVTFLELQCDYSHYYDIRNEWLSDLIIQKYGF